MIDWSNKSIVLNLNPPIGAGETRFKNINEANVFFGRNGSGKSEILRQLSKQEPNSRHLVVPERPGEIAINPSYSQDEQDGNQRAQIRQTNQVGDFRQRAVSRINTYLRKRGLTSTDKSVNIQEFHNWIDILMPEFRFRITPDVQPGYLLKDLSGRQVNSVNELSSGEADMLLVGIDILTTVFMWELDKSTNRALFLDEPNIHIHSDLDEHFANFIHQLSEKYEFTVFIATHSTSLLAAFGKQYSDRLSVFYIKKGDQEILGRRYDDHLSQLVGILGGNTIMGSIFGQPLILVEGFDDYEAWNKAARCPNGPKISVIHCSGAGGVDNDRKSLNKVFQALSSPTSKKGWALEDGDKKPDNYKPQMTDPIPKIFLECRELENLYLSDEVLENIGTNWQDVKSRIHTYIQEHPSSNAKDRLKEIIADRQKSDIKAVINIIAEIVDEKNVSWQIRVGQYLGKGRPVGKCATFLGNDALNAVWGSK